jgi:SapC protein
MVNIVPVDRARHAGKGWRRPSGYGFAKKDAVVPIVASEFARAALALPIGFVEESGFFVPVILTSPFPGRSVVVGPKGEWFVGYVPAVLRSYPFSLHSPVGGGEPTLCVDEDSGLVVPADDKTEKFFEADGSLSAPLDDVLKLLRHVAENRVLTNQAVVTLSDAGVIKRWNLVVPVGESRVPVGGFYSVDEAALNELDDAGLIGVRRALGLAYAQVLSAGQVGVLSRLASLQETARQALGRMQSGSPPSAGGEL